VVAAAVLAQSEQLPLEELALAAQYFRRFLEQEILRQPLR
jgi:hypothetical protein